MASVFTKPIAEITEQTTPHVQAKAWRDRFPRVANSTPELPPNLRLYGCLIVGDDTMVPADIQAAIEACTGVTAAAAGVKAMSQSEVPKGTFQRAILTLELDLRPIPMEPE